MKKIFINTLFLGSILFAKNEIEISLGFGSIPKNFDKGENGIDNSASITDADKNILPILNDAPTLPTGESRSGQSPTFNITYIYPIKEYLAVGSGFSYFSGSFSKEGSSNYFDAQNIKTYNGSYKDEISESKSSYFAFAEARAPYNWSPFIRLGYGFESIERKASRTITQSSPTSSAPSFILSDKYSGITNGITWGFGLTFPVHQFDAFQLRGIAGLQGEPRNGDHELKANDERTATVTDRSFNRTYVGIVSIF